MAFCLICLRVVHFCSGFLCTVIGSSHIFVLMHDHAYCYKFLLPFNSLSQINHMIVSLYPIKDNV